jgi:Domain of unknown function (DUF4331)
MKLRKVTAALLAAAVVTMPGTGVFASSHREAPGITETPKVDGTDLYMFTSYESGREDFVTIVANYHPLQDAYGGPNYFSLDPDALYEIHIDNDGDARPDISFEFNFSTVLANNGKGFKFPVGGKNVAIPLIQKGQITPTDISNLNSVEKFQVTMITEGGRRDKLTNRNATPFVPAGAETFLKPVDYIGTKTLPDYAGYAANHVYTVNLPNCRADGRMFVGQRREGFAVALGKVFDLINLNPLGPVDGERNIIADKNITSLVLELPKSCITRSGEPVIGAWTTASLPKDRTVKGCLQNVAECFKGRPDGDWVQVSRLGMPLVNEVVIGLKDKDKFNASEPKDDAQFATYVTNPTLPALIELLFPIAKAPNNFPRMDLVTAFLTGIPTLNQPANVVPSEMLRLNTAVPSKAKGMQMNLGAAAGDFAGFPNGRRPGDDVVDIELRVAMGALCHLFPDAPFTKCNPTNAPVGNAPITDGAFVSDAAFDDSFPYLRTPVPGATN